MSVNFLDRRSYLDKIRIKEGNDKCLTVWRDTYQKNSKKAIVLINDRRLTFACLYILEPQITENRLEPCLKYRFQKALGIVKQILKRSDAQIDYLADRRDTIHKTLKWMLETGYVNDGLDNAYERILDITVSVLINTYKDNAILPAVDDMIFQRNQKGRYFHDLVWAFFQSRDIYALDLVAGHICSQKQQDVDLSCCLLNWTKVKEENETADEIYQAYRQWLKENTPFLYFTGESMQFSSKPVFCRVDLARKYIYKPNSSFVKRPIIPANAREKKCLEGFNNLSYEKKTILASYSYKIHKQNQPAWKDWLASPFDEQIKAAETASEEA